MTSNNTGWGNVAGWYEEHLKGEDTYHAKVVAPNFLRVVNPKKEEAILDIGCGEGYFTRLLASSGASVAGADIAAELISIAKKETPSIPYSVAPAESLAFAKERSFDAVTCVLAIQNMAMLDKVLSEVSRVLTEKGRFIFVLNHPAFRIPEKTFWEFDAKKNVQFRRVDGYLSQSKHEIVMNPGKAAEGKSKALTYSFHRSLQDYSKALSKAGFAITKIEEWISHRESEKGPRKIAEDRARKEIPLFMCVEAKKL